MTDTCCTRRDTVAPGHACPRCADPGLRVDRTTVAALTSGVVPPNQSYRMCGNARCGVVYFGGDGMVLSQADLTIAADVKSSSPDALVCYCFVYRRADIEADLLDAGRTPIPERIAAEVKAGNCACEVRNPTGRCCLGEVHRAVAELAEKRGVVAEVSR